MSGIGMVLNTAKLAIAAQQQGLAVTSHNIANVNSPYYSRQSAVHSPRDPISYGEFWLGSGVDMSAIQRSADQLLENRLIDIKSDLASSEEMATYMNIFETALNENSESGISNLMVEFWNAWQGVSNNPTGAPERVATYEKGVETAERFDTLANDLLQIEIDLNSEISSILSEVGSICSQIADLNNELIGQGSNNISHDMLDQRNGLVTELGKLIGVHTFEQPDGSLTAVTAGGFNLVTSASALSLTFDAGRICWEGSFGGQVDITDKITGGKIGGWLEMRDEVIAKYQTELDALAKEFIWTVNYQHSQGVGLDYFDSDVTGTYATDSSGMLATLDFGHKIDYTEDFKMNVNTSGSDLYPFVTVDMAISDVVVSNLAGTGDANHAYRFTVTKAGTVGPGADDPVVAWEKINSAGTVTGSGNITITDVDTFTPDPIDGVGTLTFDIAAGSLVAGNTFTINTDAAGATAPLTLNPTGTANSILDTYKFTMTSGGTIGTDTITGNWSNAVDTGSFTLNATNTMTVDGMTLTFGNGGIFADNDVFTIATDSTGSPTEHMMSDWHWTLDSFKDQFNRDATTVGMGVTATKTSDNKITFTPGANNSIAFPGSYTMAEETSSDGSLVDATTMAVLEADELTLNGTAIRATVVGDDTDSSSDKAGSAIAIAAVINESSSTTGVRAYAEKTSVDLVLVAGAGADTAAGDLKINGIDIGIIDADAAVDTAGASAASAINAANAGVTATYTAISDTLTLTAVDGRNIRIQTDTADAATLMGAGFALSDDKVVRGNVSLYSDSAIIIAGTAPGDVGFTAETVALAASTDSGLTAALGINTFFSGDDSQSMAVNSVLNDKDYIAAATLDPTTGEFGVGDNSNANNIADLKFSTRNIAEWTYERGSDAVSKVTSFSTEDYYHRMVGSIGVKSANAHRSVAFKEALADKLGEQRDNLSAVSLDEEMINMMKYQQAYNVASKLLTVADEMLTTLINSK